VNEIIEMEQEAEYWGLVSKYRRGCAIMYVVYDVSSAYTIVVPWDIVYVGRKNQPIEAEIILDEFENPLEVKNKRDLQRKAKGIPKGLRYEVCALTDLGIANIVAPETDEDGWGRFRIW